MKKNYLTQNKLTELLSNMFEIWTEIPIEGTRFKSDIQFIFNGDKYAVEFDGDSHYCDIKVMERDIRKDRILVEKGFNVVRIPYWIQLDEITFKMLFRFDSPTPIERNYPHGFVDNKAKTPAYFCVNGIQKFLEMMDYMAEKYTDVFEEIIDSFNKNKLNKNVNDLIPLNYGYPQLKKTLDYLINFNDFTTNKQRNTFKKFLKIPKVSHPACSIENTIQS